MFKLILLSLQFALLIIIASWTVNNSYVISIEVSDYIVSTSSSYVIALLIFILLFVFFLQSFYFRAKNKISKFSMNQFIKNKEKGYDAFMSGMIALSNKDYKKAIYENKKVSKYLKETSLNLLLKSETFKIEKKYEELNLVYEEMIKNEKTKVLGFRGLMEQYLRAQDYHHAFIYAENIFKISPNIEKIYETLIYIIGKTKNWHSLINVSDKAYASKIIDKKTFSTNKSIALYEIAKIKQLDNQKESLNLIEKSLELRKNFPPYIAFYIDLLIENRKLNFAKKFLTKVWRESPHPDFKPQIKRLSEELKIEFHKLAQDITSNTQALSQSKVLRAEALVHDKKWLAAKNEISELLQHKPEREICILMSKIEEGDTNDKQKIDAWLSRANFGEMSNIWICSISNISQQNWTSVSHGGYFNSLEWGKPKMYNISKSSNFEKKQIEYIN